MTKLVTSIDLICLFRIFLAMCAGAVIGYEREQRVKVAGLRTHILISMASALMMIISKYAFNDILIQNMVPGVSVDASRVAAGIIAGMGIFSGGIVFIGKRGTVSGLTTAAGIWATIGIGMIIGAGLYTIGIGSVIFVELVQFILHRDLAIYKHAVNANVVFSLSDPDREYEVILEKLQPYGVKIFSQKWEKKADSMTRLRCDVVFDEKYNRNDIIKVLNGMNEVTGFELI